MSDAELKFPENVTVMKRVEDYLAHFHDEHGKIEYLLSGATLEELNRKVVARAEYLAQNFPNLHPAVDQDKWQAVDADGQKVEEPAVEAPVESLAAAGAKVAEQLSAPVSPDQTSAA